MIVSAQAEDSLIGREFLKRSSFDVSKVVNGRLVPHTVRNDTISSSMRIGILEERNGMYRVRIEGSRNSSFNNDTYYISKRMADDIFLTKSVKEVSGGINVYSRFGRTAVTCPTVHRSGPPRRYSRSLNNNNSEDEKSGEQSSDLEENFEKMGGSPKALKHALCFVEKHSETNFKSAAGGTVKIQDECKIAINDHAGKGERENKMFIVNKCTGEVKLMNVTRGYAGIGQGTGKTNPGFHIMGGDHESQKFWSPGIKMHGLQEGINDEAWGRGVVVHRAMSGEGNYCTGSMASSESNETEVSGECGRSAGCPAVSPENWDEVVEDLRGDSSGGPLMYNYTDDEAEKPDDYCGDNLWM
jgi:hypothetical protein